MKIGITSYSLSNALCDGRLAPLDAITWAAKHGAECFELSPGNTFPIYDDGMPEKCAARAREEGIMLSSYTIGASFIKETAEERAAEVARVKQEVDIAARLGVGCMRFDVGWRTPEQATLENFEKDLPPAAECCREIADYAHQFGIVTTVENHGFHFQGAERIQRLIYAVGRPYYRTTLDVANFSCVDEDNLASVRMNIGLAAMIHLKDFFYRPCGNPPVGGGWFRTRGGIPLHGTIIGDGSLDLRSICKVIRESGYDGCVSVEFEGMEDCFVDTEMGLKNAFKLLKDKEL